MSDTRTALDALNELVTQKASSPFVLNKSWWRCLFRSLEIFAFMMSIISIFFTITSLMTVLFGYLIGLAGMAGGAGALWGLSCLFRAAKEADAVSETHWNEITNLITNIATIRPEMATELKPLALCLRNNTLNTVWSEDVIERLNALRAAANAENKRQTATQQLNAILTSQTAGDIGQDIDTIAITDKELVDDGKPTSASSPFSGTRL